LFFLSPGLLRAQLFVFWFQLRFSGPPANLGAGDMLTRVFVLPSPGAVTSPEESCVSGGQPFFWSDSRSIRLEVAFPPTGSPDGCPLFQPGHLRHFLSLPFFFFLLTLLTKHFAFFKDSSSLHKNSPFFFRRLFQYVLPRPSRNSHYSVSFYDRHKNVPRLLPLLFSMVQSLNSVSPGHSMVFNGTSILRIDCLLLPVGTPPSFSVPVA